MHAQKKEKHEICFSTLLAVFLLRWSQLQDELHHDLVEKRRDAYCLPV
jgi:hypothetical protein